MSPGWNEFRQSQSPGGPSSDPRPTSEEERLKKLKLLIVDDEPNIVEALREVFHGQFELLHSTSPDEALALFKTHGPELVLTDQRMPKMTGLELLRQLKEINPDTLCLLVTGYSDINVVVQALNEGLVWKYVVKPWELEALRNLVRSAAREVLKRRGLSGSVQGILGL